MPAGIVWIKLIQLMFLLDLIQKTEKSYFFYLAFSHICIETGAVVSQWSP